MITCLALSCFESVFILLDLPCLLNIFSQSARHSSRTICVLISTMHQYQTDFFFRSSSKLAQDSGSDNLFNTSLFCFCLLRCLGKEVSVNQQRLRGDGVKFKCKVTYQHKLSRLTCDFSLKVLAASFAEMFAIKNRIIFPSVFWDIWYNSK